MRSASSARYDAFTSATKVRNQFTFLVGPFANFAAETEIRAFGANYENPDVARTRLMQGLRRVTGKRASMRLYGRLASTMLPTELRRSKRMVFIGFAAFFVKTMGW